MAIRHVRKLEDKNPMMQFIVPKFEDDTMQVVDTEASLLEAEQGQRQQKGVNGENNDGRDSESSDLNYSYHLSDGDVKPIRKPQVKDGQYDFCIITASARPTKGSSKLIRLTLRLSNGSPSLGEHIIQSSMFESQRSGSPWMNFLRAIASKMEHDLEDVKDLNGITGRAVVTFKQYGSGYPNEEIEVIS